MGPVLRILGFLLLCGVGMSLSSPVAEKFSMCTFPEVEYFVVEGVANHAQAELHCKSLNFTNLLFVDSDEELRGPVSECLGAHPIGSEYWIDGIFDTVQWRWWYGEPFPDWAPWDDERVDSLSNNVVMRFFNKFAIEWLTRGNGELLKYICKRLKTPTEPLPTVPVPCNRTNDLVIVLDSSLSITPPNYDIAKNFVANLTIAYANNINSRQGFIIYSDTASTIFNLPDILTNPQMEAAIKSAPLLGNSTNTAAGITMAMNILIANQRPGVPMNMIVLTDGVSNDRNATQAAAEMAISREIRTFAVGMTNSVNVDELLDITGRRDDNVFLTPDFDGLLALLRRVSLGVCQ